MWVYRKRTDQLPSHYEVGYLVKGYFEVVETYERAIDARNAVNFLNGGR